MNRRRPALFLAIALLVAAATFLPARAQSTSETNLRFRITLADVAADGSMNESAYEFVTLDRTSTELLTGWRVPIPTTTREPASGKQGKAASVTSYTYQNVGVTAVLEPRIIENNRVRVKARIEVSGLDRAAEEPLTTASARLGTFQHKFDAVLETGVPVTVSDSPKPGGGSMRVKIEAFVGG